MKILHVITGLNAGGAEMMLFKLLAAFRAGGGPGSEVISLIAPGVIGPRIESLGIAVHSPGMTPGVGALAKFPRLMRMVRAAAPDIVQCWMYHGNLMGGLAARAVSKAPVIWGLRQSNLDPAESKRGTITIAKIGARLSRLPDTIVCVSESARRVHEALGYDAGRMVVIPNGFDLDAFRPDSAARAAVRAELGLPADAPLVGLVARFDPQKDHANFLRAAARVASARPDVRFLLMGDGMNGATTRLARMIAETGIAGHLHLLGRRDDVPRLTAALDVAVSASAFGEGFPNALGEALCAGVPVATTDVGDSAEIVGAEGRVVPPRDAAALGDAIAQLLALAPEARHVLGARARARMERDYALPAVARRWLALYEGLLT